MTPPHILIARSSRGPHTPNPSASLSSPTETHAAAAGIFRSSGSPPWYLEECESDEVVSSLSAEGDGDDPIEIDETFTRNARFPGTVKIIVESTTFWAHKEVLYFASSFFQAALSGSWAETGPNGRPRSISSIITISQAPVTGAGQSAADGAPESHMTFAPMDPDMDPDEVDLALDFDLVGNTSGSEAGSSTAEEKGKGKEQTVKDKEKARESSMKKLEGSPTAVVKFATSKQKPSDADDEQSDSTDAAANATAKPRLRRRSKLSDRRPDAVIVLKEEKASTFHDFLKFVYPHLVCTITWANVEGLMNLGHRLHVSALESSCLTWLLGHAAGRPIKAMHIAERFDEDELYREASRFVLDNAEGWPEDELNTLSQETLLKLEKRRTWFLERVLKLGLFQIAKEYQCCSTCPDPPTCARLLEEKWRQAYHAAFRFGPCQPSMVFRYLRTLEGVSPPLSLTHLSCQTTAKAFIATLFDRMFSLGVRGSGTDTAPLGARVAAVAGASTAGARRHFLYCTLHAEQTRTKRSREIS